MCPSSHEGPVWREGSLCIDSACTIDAVIRLVLAAVLALVRPTGGVDAIPQGPTPVEKLSTKKLRHDEVLRIRRDFGKANWEIVLDGWSSRVADGHLERVRLWWANTEDGERRKPFSAYLRRYLELDVQRVDESTLLVRMSGDGKEYLFSVEVDEHATPAVFVDVQLADGSTVAHCRCDSALLVARRVIGIPVGIAALTVHCTDADAIQREGTVPYRERADTKPYEPE
jgi:hypothetical protein